MGRISSRLGQTETSITGVEPGIRTFDARLDYEILRRNYRLTLADLRDETVTRRSIEVPSDSALGKLMRFLNQFNP